MGQDKKRLMNDIWKSNLPKKDKISIIDTILDKFNEKKKGK